MSDEELTCSFCFCKETEVKTLIAGPNEIYICDECVLSCLNLLIYKKDDE